MSSYTFETGQKLFDNLGDHNPLAEIFEVTAVDSSGQAVELKQGKDSKGLSDSLNRATKLTGGSSAYSTDGETITVVHGSKHFCQTSPL